MSTRLKLLQLFEDRKTPMLSGMEAAKSFSLTRGAIWKHMLALKQAGFPIESQDRTGYLFRSAPDFSLSRYLPDRPFVCHYSLVCRSTQTTARQAAESGLPHGHLWVSEIQTHGRGRLERHWDSGFGGLWFSAILRPVIGLKAVAPLAITAARVWVKVLQDLCHLRARVKWPNDVVITHKGKRRKIAGILTEMTGESDRIGWIVLGVGMNVNNELPTDLRETAVSLRQLTGQSWNRARLLDAFLKRFVKTDAFRVKSRSA